MSNPALNWAFQQSVQPATTKFVLVTMADSASADTGESFISIQTIHKLTGLDADTVASALKRLVNMGLIEDTGERRGLTGQTRVYRLLGESLCATKYEPSTGKKRSKKESLKHRTSTEPHGSLNGESTEQAPNKHRTSTESSGSPIYSGTLNPEPLTKDIAADAAVVKKPMQPFQVLALAFRNDILTKVPGFKLTSREFKAAKDFISADFKPEEVIVLAHKAWEQTGFHATRCVSLVYLFNHWNEVWDEIHNPRTNGHATPRNVDSRLLQEQIQVPRW